MPFFHVEVLEDVRCSIRFTVLAETREEAAQQARDLWVDSGAGEKHESVNKRWVEIDGEEIEPAYNP